MSENKKYYYMKLKENFFTSERMVVLETMPDGILYSNLLLKMYLMSLKHNGILLLHENLPHTPQTIATFTRHQIGTVERALQIFLKLGFVELLTDGAYYMPDIQLLVGRSSTEAERKRRERLRLQTQQLLPSSTSLAFCSFRCLLNHICWRQVRPYPMLLLFLTQSSSSMNLYSQTLTLSGKTMFRSSSIFSSI